MSDLPVSAEDTAHTETSHLPTEVRAFYERHPYPAPVIDLDSYRELWRQGDRRRAAFHVLWPNQPYRDDL